MVGRAGGAAGLAAGLLAGATFGVLDALLTFAAEPDPGRDAYRLGYALGPIFADAAGGGALGAVAGALVRPASPAALAAGLMAVLWATSILVAVPAAASTPVWVAATGAVALAAVALGRLARDAAAAVSRGSLAVRRAGAAAAAGLALGAGAALLPAGVDAFRGGTGPCADASRPPAGAPDLLLVTVDALRADSARSMRAYARLVARGSVYEQHVTPSPWTLPAMASLFTGLPEAQHGAGRSLSAHSLAERTRLGRESATLARRLGEHGYATHAIVTNPYLAPSYGVDAGFCSFENLSGPVESARGLSHSVPLRLAGALVPGLLPSDRADRVRARGAAWLSDPPDRPFFLWLHFLDPHAPYGDRDGASTSITLDLLALQSGRGFEVPFGALASIRAGEYRPDAAERARVTALYEQDVAYVDAQLERLLDLLELSPRFSRALVVLTADHGEEFWEHGGVEHGHTLHEEVVRVPLVMAGPGIPQGVRKEATSALDLAPTLLAVAGLASDDLPGADLRGPLPLSRALRLEGLLFGPQWVGVRSSPLKYLRSEFGEERLYDLAADPAERRDVAGAREPELAELRRSAAALGLSTLERGEGPALSIRERRALRALGYAD